METTLGLAYFLVCALFAIAGALVTVFMKNPIHCAMGLLLTILCVAGLFLSLHAEFLAVIQLIVYAGAIVILFLFVIMLLGPSSVGPRDQRGLFARLVGGALFLVGAGLSIYFIVRGARLAVLKEPEADFGSVGSFGRLLFSDDLVPFELSAALLMVAVLGAVAVARGKVLTGPAKAAKTETATLRETEGHS
jgi:NADH-quinone oxidoreductase subunit J